MDPDSFVPILLRSPCGEDASVDASAGGRRSRSPIYEIAYAGLILHDAAAPAFC